MTDDTAAAPASAPASADAPRVALLGTGVMGSGMSRSILRAGLPLTVWNRSAEKAAPLADAGATVADSAADAVRDADVVVVMLFDADAVLAVLADVAPALRPDAVVLQSSTVGVEGTRRIAALAAEHDIRLVDAPVLGTRGPAEQGLLVHLVSGSEADLAVARPVLEATGSRTVVAGSAAGAGSALKLACNAWIASITAGIGQSLGLAQLLGVEPRLFLDAIAGGASDTPYAHLKGGAMLAGELAPSFALDGLLKDVTLMLAALDGADAHDFDTAMLEALRETYAEASAAGHGGDDVAAVGTVFGLPASSGS
ncbi:NAD(P)-dependent oxidoreductase [Clavibacter sp. Sh2141]|uniref:NAD(P)-dependent oxidoreductase n=1 Tax=Clavibacter sp. Sh2141 TaxID=3395374 RepID=UPI0039BD694D